MNPRRCIMLDVPEDVTYTEGRLMIQAHSKFKAALNSVQFDSGA